MERAVGCSLDRKNFFSRGLAQLQDEEYDSFTSTARRRASNEKLAGTFVMTKGESPTHTADPIEVRRRLG
jgi:hypothetical protein